jgi:hypothetical protein
MRYQTTTGLDPDDMTELVARIHDILASLDLSSFGGRSSPGGCAAGPVPDSARRT